MIVLRFSVAMMSLSAVALAGAIAWYNTHTTERYLDPVDMIYTHTGDGDCGTAPSPSGWCVTLRRETPEGEVWASWVVEIRVLAEGGADCSDSGVSRYQVAPGGVVTYPASAALVPCLEAGERMTVDTRHVVYAGPIPLAPNYSTYTFAAED